MTNSSRVVGVGLALLVVGGIAAYWVLPATNSPGAPVAPVAAGYAPAQGAPGFDGQAPAAAPGAAHPMQLGADTAAPAATQAPAARSAAAPEKPVAPVHITGRVIDEVGRPVKGAAVAFFDDVAGLMFPRPDGRERLDQAPHTETDADGRFALTASVPVQVEKETQDFLFDSRARLSVRHDAFATLVHSCGDVAPGEFDAGDLQLEPGAWILGRVVDSAGRPLAGADVRARNDDSGGGGAGGGGRGGGRRGGRNNPGGMFGGGLGSTLDAFTTGNDGRFTVHGLRAGTADLTARKDGLRLADVSGIQLEVRVPKDVGDVVLEQGVSISGVVLDGDGSALAGAEVSVSSMTRLVVNRIEDLPRAQLGQEFGQRAVADSAGRFEVSGLAGGTYNVHVRADGHAPLDREDVPAGTSNLRLEPIRLGALLLSVLDSKTGQPVEGARIKATPTRTEQGRFFQPEQPLPVLAGSEALAAAGTSAGALPPAAAAYFVRNAGVDGTDLVIAAEHYATQAIEAPAVASREVLPFTVRLVPDSLVAGQVVDEKRQPVDGATVTLRKAPADEAPAEGSFVRRFERRISVGGNDEEQPDADSITARTGVDGRFELRGAAAGDWNVVASAPDRVRSEPQRITLDEGRPQADVTIVLVTAGSIGGLVTEFDGTPAADVEILVEARSAPADAAGGDGPEQQVARQVARMFGNQDGSGNGPHHTRTDNTGTYTVANLAEGEYGVKINAGPRRSRNFGPAMVITLAGDGNEDTDNALTWTKVAPGTESRVNLVRPRRGVVTGTVMAAGQPVPNLSVSLRPQSQGFFGGERADTDGHGEFRFEDVEAGSYTVSAQAPGAALPERAPVTLEAGQERHANLIFSGSTLSGRVVDTANNAGVAGILLHVDPVQDATPDGQPGGEPRMAFEMITVSGNGSGPPSGMNMTVGGGRSESAHTDAKGNFTLNYMKPGRYTLEASGGGYMRSTLGPVEVLENENKSDVLMGVTRGGVVEGIVVSGSTGDRLDKVPVRLEGGDDRQMTVTSNGSYHFDGLQPGEYTVNVLGSGFNSDPIASEKVQIEKNGDVRKLDLTTKQS